MLTELAKREPLSLQETPILWTVNPLAGKTTDWRAGCGRSARPVRREGASKPIGAPYPYRIARIERSDTGRAIGDGPSTTQTPIPDGGTAKRRSLHPGYELQGDHPLRRLPL